MNKKLILAVLAATFAAAPALVLASDDLAKKSGCIACHDVDKKIVGPGYKEVAAKYRSDKGAEAKLIDKVKKGGTGVWGQVPMPPNAHVSDDNIKALVKWILALK